VIRALHSELLSKISSQVLSWNEFSQVETRRVERHFFAPTLIFKGAFRLVPTLIFANFSWKLGSEQVGTSWDEFGRLRHYWNFSEIRKKSISETRENENFGKKRLTHGLKSDFKPLNFIKCSTRNFWASFVALKLSCNSRFQCAFTACIFIFKVITLVGSSQRNYFENATACIKRTLKTTVATQL